MSLCSDHLRQLTDLQDIRRRGPVRRAGVADINEAESDRWNRRYRVPYDIR